MTLAGESENKVSVRIRQLPAAWQLASILSLVVLVPALEVITTHQVLTAPHPGANDFYSRWRAAQLYWQAGVDPYCEQATAAIQQGIYGRPAQPGEDPGPFVYPFYTVFLLLPLAWLPYSWAEAVWLVILEACLLGGVWLYLATLRWRLPAWLVACVGVWAVLFYHGARTILLGQFAGLVFVLMVGSLYLLRRDRAIAAGVALALTTIKPQMSVLFVLAMVVWGIGQRRWRLLAGLVGALAVLGGASFALLPGWLHEFVSQVADYPRYTSTCSPVWMITHIYLPQLGTPFEVGLSTLLLLYILIEWRQLPGARAGSERFHWLIGLTLIVTNLVMVRTATTNYVALYLPLLYGLKVVADRRPRRARWWVAGVLLVSLVAGWALFLSTVQGRLEHPIMYLPLPVGLFVALIAIRPAWQATDPAEPGRDGTDGDS